MDQEGQDSFLDSRGDKKQPSVTRPVQVTSLVKIVGYWKAVQVYKYNGVAFCGF